LTMCEGLNGKSERIRGDIPRVIFRAANRSIAASRPQPRAGMR
jgi:hypothetical protein